MIKNLIIKARKDIKLCKGLVSLMSGIMEDCIKNRKTTSIRKMGTKIALLGNGPSQEEFWENKNKFRDYDLLCVNYFIVKFKERFYEAKPKYICFSDPMMFAFKGNLPEVEKMKEKDFNETWEIINSIDWTCYLIHPNKFKITKLNNENVKTIELTSKSMNFDQNVSCYKLYLSNHIKPIINAVMGDALYFALIFKYEEIALFGVESNSLWNMEVDKNNEIIFVDKHNYGEEKLEAKKTFNTVGLHEEILSQYNYFNCFYQLSILAKILNTKVTNYSVSSYIDSFDKKTP
ncbi:MAG: hypothetical protein PHX08_02280 [Lachnospiraceae bacterium]|nr:hypothetical protein [Lachnospiraceae bacterium]